MTNYFDDPVLGQSADGPSADADAQTETTEASEPSGSTAPEAVDAVQARFAGCRWHSTQEDGGPPYCSHRDVLPYAGKNGFNPEAWCPECTFYKLKRTVRKRSTDFDDDYD